MENTHFLPPHYRPKLDLYHTQLAIKQAKDDFEDELAALLHLSRVSAPLFVDKATGLNDDLNGVERPVEFDIKEQPGIAVQVVQSLAKWKRYALGRYGYPVGQGLYTDMNAIRRDEETDNLHSIYVDQWDWEKVISAEMRTESMLRIAVNAIVGCICDAALIVRGRYPSLSTSLSREVSFITSQELEDLYPDLTPKEREHAYVRKHPTTFLSQIGGKLRSGQPHDGRAPDYDDWSLNGDILFYNPLLDCAFEVSSMGIRVDPQALDSQLTLAGCDARRSLTYHRMLLEGKLPLTMGGGIGQSRLCMLLLGKAHIGEVQSSLWPDEMMQACEKSGIQLL